LEGKWKEGEGEIRGREGEEKGKGEGKGKEGRARGRGRWKREKGREGKGRVNSPLKFLRKMLKLIFLELLIMIYCKLTTLTVLHVFQESLNLHLSFPLCIVLVMYKFVN
jgi:hypothetical protein